VLLSKFQNQILLFKRNNKEWCFVIVYIDSNILFKDPYLRSNKMVSLLNVIDSTNSKLKIPSVVQQETLNNLVKKVQSIRNELQSNIKLLSSNMLNKSDLDYLSMPDFSEEDFRRDYSVHLGKLVYSGSIEIVDHKTMNQEMLLDDLLHRALHSIKPFKEGKEEFKDAMIWNTIIHDIRFNGYQDCIFISANVSDFYSADKVSLHDDLINDIPEGVTVKPYRNIEDFIASEEVKTALENAESSSLVATDPIKEKKLSEIASKINKEYLMQNLQYTYEYYVTQSLGTLSHHLSLNAPEYYLLYFPLLYTKMHYFNNVEAHFTDEVFVEILSINDFKVVQEENFIMVVCYMNIVPKIKKDIKEYPSETEFATLRAKISFTIDENEKFEEFDMGSLSPLQVNGDLFKE